MTAIVGFAHKGRVYIGGDSAGTWNDLFQVIRSDPKVFRLGPLLIGFTYSWRMGQLLRHKLRVPDRDPRQDAHGWLCTAFVDAVRAAFKENGFTWSENTRELGGPFLVGYEGRLYEVGSEFDVADYGAGIAAVGCGRDFALGAMAVLKDANPRVRVRKALEAAARFSAGVRGPFVVESV